MHTFPFGQPVLPVEQLDQSPKDVFVLGVYASAVHARWVGDDGQDRIKAVAVASEPELIWTGHGAEELGQGLDHAIRRCAGLRPYSPAQ